jgi:hypothetical protein
MKSKISARDYLLKYPSATTKAVMRATGVSAKTVYSVRWKLKQDEKDPVKDKANSERAKTLIISPNTRLIGSENAVPRPKARLASSADFPITDKTEFIMPAPVNHPTHYTTGGIETIDFIEAKNLNYNLGNVVKYITRADHKGNRIEDLQKAKWYLEREILSAHI